MRDDPSTSKAEGENWLQLSESVLRDFFNKRLEALQKHETPHLVPDMENMTVVSAEKYLVFHIPFLPQSGANQQWAHAKDSPEYGGLSDKSAAPRIRRRLAATFTASSQKSCITLCPRDV